MTYRLNSQGNRPQIVRCLTPNQQNNRRLSIADDSAYRGFDLKYPQSHQIVRCDYLVSLRSEYGMVRTKADAGVGGTNDNRNILVAVLRLTALNRCATAPEVCYNKSGLSLNPSCRSGEMVDAPVSKTGGGNPMSVRLRPSAPIPSLFSSPSFPFQTLPKR